MLQFFLKKLFSNCVKAGLAIFCVLIIALFVIFLYDDRELCLTTGHCREGLYLNTENGEILINEETCLNDNGHWDEKRRWCVFHR